MKYVSFSQYNIYTSCPFNWKLNYVDKRRIPSASIHLVFGTAMHDALQGYLTVFYTQTVKAANELDVNSILLNSMLRELEEYKLSRPPKQSPWPISLLKPC